MGHSSGAGGSPEGVRGCWQGCGRENQDAPGVGLVHGSQLPRDAAPELRRDRWHCYLCYVLPLKFRPPDRCDRHLVEHCTLVKGHPPPCKDTTKGESKKSENATRDGEPTLAAARQRRHPMFEKRSRQGPHWVPPARRV